MGNALRVPVSDVTELHASQMKAPAHDVYSVQLRSLRHGHALWCPEPSQQYPTSVGDVGYLSGGAFHRLFNAIVPAEDPRNARMGVPEGFEQLCIPSTALYFNDKYFDAGALRSWDVRELRAGISATG